MGRHKIRFLACAISLLSFLAAPAGAVTLTPGESAPEFSLPDIDGKNVSLAHFRDKTIILAFWSTWCSRCEEELAFLRDQFGEREDVVVLLINQDSERKVPTDRIVAIREKLGIRFPIIVDTGLVLWNRFGINALPTSVVIGKDGRIVFVEANFYWGSPENLIKAVSPG